MKLKLRDFTWDDPLRGEAINGDSLTTIGVERRCFDYPVQEFLIPRDKLIQVFPTLKEYESKLPLKLVVKLCDFDTISNYYNDNEEDIETQLKKLETEVLCYERIHKHNCSSDINREQQINVPTVYFTGFYEFIDIIEEGPILLNGRLLITEYLESDIVNKDEVKFDNLMSVDKIIRIKFINDCLKIIKNLNEIGIIHNGLSLNNFLLSKGKLYLINYTNSRIIKDNENIVYEICGKEPLENYIYLLNQFKLKNQ